LKEIDFILRYMFSDQSLSKGKLYKHTLKSNPIMISV